MKVARYWKAIVAAAVAGTGALSTAIDDGTLTAGEMWITAVAVLSAGGFTWAVPNKPTQPREDPYQ